MPDPGLSTEILPGQVWRSPEGKPFQVVSIGRHDEVTLRLRHLRGYLGHWQTAPYDDIVLMWEYMGMSANLR